MLIVKYLKSIFTNNFKKVIHLNVKNWNDQRSHLPNIVKYCYKLQRDSFWGIILYVKSVEQ